MDKLAYINKIKTMKLKKHTKELIKKQIEQFYLYNEKKNIKYKIGEEVLLSNNNLIHGTRANIETLNIISKEGLISSEFYSDLNKNKKKPYVVEFWTIEENITLSEWVKKYAGVTIEFKNRDGKPYKNIISSFENIKINIQNETGFRDYTIYQNQEQRFIPNDIIENDSTLAFIIDYTNDNELIKNDIFSENLDYKIIKDLLPRWFYQKYLKNRNFDHHETGREKAILFGIPPVMIEGIMVSRKLENNNNYLKELKNLFPNCYICNIDGKVIL